MFKWLLLFLFVATSALAQNATGGSSGSYCPTIAIGNYANNCASTAFVANTITSVSGDVTFAGTSSIISTITANAVTNAKLATMAAATIKGNNTGSTGPALDLTPQQVETLLIVTNYIGTSSINADIAAVGSAVKTIYYAVPTTLSANLTVPKNVTLQFMAGGYVTQGASYTLTINGQLQAGISQIFSGFSSGQISFASALTSTCYPEWWGATVNNTGVDNAAYINDSIAACPVTQLQAAIYYTTATILMQANTRSLLGVDFGFPGTSTATMIANQSATATIMQVGPNSIPVPGTTTNFQNSNLVKGIYIYRTVAPTISAGGIGILAQYCSWLTLDNLIVQDNIYGIEMIGLNQPHFHRAVAIRTLAGTGGGTDIFYGFYLNGATNIGGAGGSESVYITESAAISGIAPTTATNYQGFVALGTYGYSDIFLNRFETSQMNTGITLVGNGNSTTTPDIQNEDVRIENPVLDGCFSSGITLSSTSAYGAIQIIGGYIELSSSSPGPIGLLFSSSLGRVFATGLQFLMSQNASTTSFAVKALSSKNITMIGNMALEASSVSGVYYLSGVTNSRFQDTITNNGVTNGNSAVNINSSSSRNVLDMTINGKASAFSVGYYLSDATPTFNEFRSSGLDAAAFSTAKLYNNGTAITSAGAFGSGSSNLASGIMN